MNPAPTLPELLSSSPGTRFNALELVPELVKLPLGKLYANYLIFGLTRQLRRLLTYYELSLRVNMYSSITPGQTDESRTKLSAHLVASRAMAVEAKRWSAHGILYKFLAVRFVRVIEKNIEMTERCLAQLATRDSVSFTHAELDDPEEQAFSNAFSQKSALDR